MNGGYFGAFKEKNPADEDSAERGEDRHDLIGSICPGKLPCAGNAPRAALLAAGGIFDQRREGVRDGVGVIG
jgi:hypothetical protein